MNGNLSRLVRHVLALSTAALFVAGCASTPSVDVQRNEEITAGAFRSFAWVDPLGTDREGYESFVTVRLKRDVQAALEARGMTYDEANPDARVNFYANVEARQEVRRVPVGPLDARYVPGAYGYYGFRAGLYDPFPVYDTEVREYNEGTLTIDVVEASTNRLAWSGTLHGRVTKKALEDPETTTRIAVERVLSEFP